MIILDTSRYLDIVITYQNSNYNITILQLYRIFAHPFNVCLGYTLVVMLPFFIMICLLPVSFLYMWVISGTICRIVLLTRLGLRVLVQALNLNYF